MNKKYEVKDFLQEQPHDEFPYGKIFSGLEHNVVKETSRTIQIKVLTSDDRISIRDSILDKLSSNSISASLEWRGSSIESIVGNFGSKKLIIDVKPKSGGMNETTLNSSITELFPCIAFETNHRPVDVDSFYKYLLSVDVRKLKCVGPKDIDAAVKTIQTAEGSTKFREKMENAIAVLKYINSHDKRILNVYWGYRQKPRGVPKNHPGDIFIEFEDKQILGVSLKAGGKKTKEPQLNTYVTNVFENFGEMKLLKKYEELVYNTVYSKIEGILPFNLYSQRKNLKKTAQAILNHHKKDSKQYEQDYNTSLETMRTSLIELFNRNLKNSLNFIKSQILRDAPDVPTVVVKAVGNKWEEVTDKDEVGVFLPSVEFIRAYSSTKSKQNWFIELKSGDDIITMQMSIRTNKAGSFGVRKLGQLPTKLAVKYNGLKKK